MATNTNATSDRGATQSLSFDAFCEQLCDGCKIVRWLWTPDPPRDEFPVADGEKSLSGPHFQLSDTCLLCQQLCNLVPEGGIIDRVYLRLHEAASMLTSTASSNPASSSCYDFLELSSIDSNQETLFQFAMMVAMDETDLNSDEFDPGSRIEVENTTMRLRKLKTDTTNYNRIRAWLDTCLSCHGSSCLHTQTIEVPGLKFIDCLTETVVPATGNSLDYAALSYVWGKVDDGDMQSSAFPHTIRDSMTVTRALGLRYLWVDRYASKLNLSTVLKISLQLQCIDQNNASEKHIQINLMDRIYAQARFTIIAATGNSWTGLPGVSSKERQAQESLQLGDIEMLSIPSATYPRPESSWATRAWTFQEGALSPRRIIFDKQEVIYLCQQDVWLESSVSLSMNSARLGWPSGDHYRMLIPSGYRHQWGTSLDHAESLLQEYCSRDLTFPSDALKACLGALNATSVTHFWGVPIGSNSRSLHSVSMSFCWRNTVSGEERREFPSWSWARWSGAKSFGIWPAKPNVLIEIKLDTGEWADVSQIETLRGNVNFVSSSRILRLTGTTIPTRCVHDGNKWYTTVNTTQSVEIRFPISMDNREAPADAYGGALLLFCTSFEYRLRGWNTGLNGTALVVLPHEQSFIRIGMVDASDFNYDPDFLECRQKLEEGPMSFENACRRTILLE